MQDFYADSKPLARWWWFSGEIRREDIAAQLEWLSKTGFGGVEIAWVYPQKGAKPGPKWLSPEWSGAVAFAKEKAAALGMCCDFTFGTLWPFGGSNVPEKFASRNYDGLSPQRLKRSWEEPHAQPGFVLNHLDRHALEDYSAKMGAALAGALQGGKSALFCDSWEVATDGLWTDGFGKRFKDACGYEVEPLMKSLDDHPDERYDYRKFLSSVVLEEFFRPFASLCGKLGGFSRVQAHGAPVDLLAAYASADVPESEALLFDPHFSTLAASAAALSGKKVVSCETFTCLYGWVPYPGTPPHIGEEQTADMKLLADALFANGVNMVVWHGMPYTPSGGSNRFYATVHVGPDSGFAADLPDFNAYMSMDCSALRRGALHTDAAAYLPIEDCLMQGKLPEKLRKPSAEHYWELQHLKPHPDLAGRMPVWVSFEFLKQATVSYGIMRIGEASFRTLHVDSGWLDAQALEEILRLAQGGLRICLKRKPAQPGKRKSKSYGRILSKLCSLANVFDTPQKAFAGPPIVEGRDLPEFTARRDGDALRLFFAHPLSRTLSYPMKYGHSSSAGAVSMPVAINALGKKRDVTLEFKPRRSLLLTVDSSGVSFEDLAYDPPPPKQAGA